MDSKTDKVMPITWVEPAYFGPFAVPTRIPLDPRVTVITGANDTGKTALLNAIWLAFSRNAAEEHQVNQERMDHSGQEWQQDKDINCGYGILVTQAGKTRDVVAGDVVVGDEIACVRSLAQKGGPAAKAISHQGTVVNRTLGAIKHPQSLMLREVGVRNPLVLSQANETERKLLTLGFGPEFALESLGSLSRSGRVNRITRAQERLNERLREILPVSQGLEFRLADPADAGKELIVSLVDPVRCFVPIGCRGAGVNKLISLMGSLLSIEDVAQPTVILLDEPENSLHADAQHTLRRLLEKLAESPWLQVVYATHSPSMINTMRPESIRVLARSHAGGKPTSVLVNMPHQESFLGVRASLGLNPADSLLYAPVVLIVEGETEIRCLPQALEKLGLAAVQGFHDMPTVLPEVCCVDGMGFNFAQVCRFAKAQRVKPIVFLDGDMEGHKRVQRLTEEHGDVPVLFCGPNREFEQIVPVARYLEALAIEVELDKNSVTTDALASWVREHPGVAKLAFSKQVENWVLAEFNEKYSKPAVMVKAVEVCEPEEIDADVLRPLVAAIRTALEAC